MSPLYSTFNSETHKLYYDRQNVPQIEKKQDYPTNLSLNFKFGKARDSNNVGIMRQNNQNYKYQLDNPIAKRNKKKRNTIKDPLFDG